MLERKGQDGLNEIVGKNTGIKGDCGESPVSEESYRERIDHIGDYFCSYCHEQNGARNMTLKDASGEVLEGNDKHIIGKWRKGNPCYKAAEDLVKLCSVG